MASLRSQPCLVLQALLARMHLHSVPVVLRWVQGRETGTQPSSLLPGWDIPRAAMKEETQPLCPEYHSLVVPRPGPAGGTDNKEQPPQHCSGKGTGTALNLSTIWWGRDIYNVTFLGHKCKSQSHIYVLHAPTRISF